MSLKLWVAYNGWMGYGPVAALVAADDEQTARAAAQQALHARAVEQGLEGDELEAYSVIQEIGEMTLPYVGDSL